VEDTVRGRAFHNAVPRKIAAAKAKMSDRFSLIEMQHDGAVFAEDFILHGVFRPSRPFR
jgi:hypothetical protein